MPNVPDFEPKRKLVSSVTRAEEAVITTSSAHEYESGYVIRLSVPRSYGMSVFKDGIITVIDSTSFSVTINTTNEDVFTEPTYPPVQFTPAQVVPISGITDNEAT